MIRNKSEEIHYLNILGLKQRINISSQIKTSAPKILIVGMHRIGDLVVILPSMRAIRNHFKRSKITVMSNTAHKGLLMSQKIFDDFIPIAAEEFNYREVAKKFDVIFMFRNWFGGNTIYSEEPLTYIFSTDLLVGHPKFAHLHYLDALKLLGIKSYPQKPEIILPDSKGTFGKRLLNLYNFNPKSDLIIAVHPGSGYDAKRWPNNRYKIIIKWLIDCFNAKLIFIQGQSEKSLIDSIITDIPDEHYAVLTELPLLDIAQILKHCRFFLGNDTGIMHIADAVGCPVIALFGPSRSSVWGPSSNNSVCLAREDMWWSCPYCSGRHLKDKPCSHPNNCACLRAIQIDDVMGGVESLISILKLRDKFTKNTPYKITDNLIKIKVDDNDYIFANARTMKPLFIHVNGNKFEKSLEKILALRTPVNKYRYNENERTLFDTFLLYRIAVPQREKEKTLRKKDFSERLAILSHPLFTKYGKYLTKSKSSLLEIKKQDIPVFSRANKKFKYKKDNKGRILFVNSIHPNIYGGGEKWIIRTGKELKNRGYDVFSWGIREHNWLADAQLNGILPLDIPVPLSFDFHRLPDLVKYIKNLSIDVAFLNLDRDVLSVGFPLKLANVSGVIMRKGLPHIEKEQFLRWGYKNIINGIITPSSEIRDEIIRKKWMLPVNTWYIPNGVNSNINTVKEDLDNLKQTLGINRKDILLLTVGRLAKQKGVNFLIDALPDIIGKFPTIKLIIIGEGEKKKELSKQAERLMLTDYIKFVGKRTDVGKFMAISDCFVLPSLYEGMSTAMLEAMAYGLPVVATNVYGAKDIIKNNHNGILVPSKNSNKLSKSIISILSNGGRDSDIAINGKENVKINFSFNKMIDSIESIINNYI